VTLFWTFLKFPHYVRWIQPLFWMILIEKKSSILDRFKNIYYLALPGFLLFLYPPWDLKFDYPAYLLMFYGTSWWIFTYLYTKQLGFTQAVSLSALMSFVGSFYWEIPAIIVHTYRIGLHWELYYRVFHVMIIWFLLESFDIPQTKKTIILLSLGLCMSCCVLIMYPNPNFVCWGRLEFWLTDPSPWIHLLNRIVCMYCLGTVFMEAARR